MPQKNPVWESMTKVELIHLKIRVWREEEYANCEGPDNEVLEIIRSIGEDGTPFDYIDQLGDLLRVSAVEVVNRAGNGIVYYPDWR